MAAVVFLRGVNVGGHRRFRPTELVSRLAHLDAVNIGAAGTFIFRKPVAFARLREEIAGALPFETEIIVCRGRDVAALVERDLFADHPDHPEIVRFVSVLARAPRPDVPRRLPPEGPWLVKVLSLEGRFVVGVYRRHMKTIGELGKLDRLYGAPATTRGWSTLLKVARLLGEGAD